MIVLGLSPRCWGAQWTLAAWALVGPLLAAGPSQGSPGALLHGELSCLLLNLRGLQRGEDSRGRDRQHPGHADSLTYHAAPSPGGWAQEAGRKSSVFKLQLGVLG